VISGSQDIDPRFFNFKIENVHIEDNIIEIKAHKKEQEFNIKLLWQCFYKRLLSKI
jgi:hypothetical protein